jgi:tetratricopeptide (TPR) repeat protein
MGGDKGLERAFGLLRSGQLRASEEVFAALLETGSDAAECWCGLGLAHMRSGNTPEALECFRLALKRNPVHADAEFHLGAIAESRRLLNVALDHYRSARDFDPEHAGAASALKRFGDAEDCRTEAPPVENQQLSYMTQDKPYVRLPAALAFVVMMLGLAVMTAGAVLLGSLLTLVHRGFEAVDYVFPVIGIAAIACGVRLFVQGVGDVVNRQAFR